MAKKSESEKVTERHYHDLLDLNKRFINSMTRPRPLIPGMAENAPKSKKPLTKKQLRALASGRKILAAKHAKIIQI